MLSHKDEYPGRGLKRWRNVPAISRIRDIARWAIAGYSGKRDAPPGHRF